ncbi:tyrosine-type recombinase/integrase [Jiangella alba]|uniref:Site-specific recombinase XerD n=1 Tax=Jiangella alba TaxID=561176 RepID=A0A1H5PMC4_9ACTN|nr:site-specific integrase [Jiangella alba]SEF14368.1 Site-specific recombinase XerD [Jiangella alba]
MATRRPNGASSIYLGKDGDWHGRVTVGIKDDGSPDRRHVQRKTEAEVIAAVRKLERDRDTGKVRKAGQRWTVEKWLTHWIENIAVPPTIGHNTHAGYLTDVKVHLIPGIGKHRLERLAPEHLEKLYLKIQVEKGRKPGTAHHVHRTIRLALNVALKRGYLTANPASLAKAPSLEEPEVEPYEVEETRRLLKLAMERRNGTRWAIALALGLRQGEALGLKWSHVDLKTGTLRVRRSALRPRYAHGCSGSCGKKRAGDCPNRKRVNPETKETKSRAGRREVGVPAELMKLLEDHRRQQDRERREAGDAWHDEDRVFAKPDGRALVPSTDYHEWKRLLKAAGVRDGRLHDARHTAATALLILGVPERTVMSIMGWSTTAMAARYQHVVDSIRRAVAEQVDGLLWRPDE